VTDAVAALGATFPYDGVLWDMDGTLADSEPLHGKSIELVCADLGLSLPDDFHGKLLGKTDVETHGWLVDCCGLSLSFDSWLTRRLEVYLDRVHAVEPIDEALALWQRLEDFGVRQAVVSNSDRLIVNANLARLGMARPGLVSVSRNDVVRGKPAPEPYLRAAQLLGLTSARVAVVEDSETGRASAIAAGMEVFMMPGFPDQSAGPCPSLDDIRRLLPGRPA
jgi:beta-phosphoglucomutase-like phosphatase (HAD superfamily)